MPIIDKLKDAKIIIILVISLLIVFTVYKIANNFIEASNRTASEQNIAVAVKAKADLVQATEQLNKAAEEMKTIQERLKADEALREKNKEIIETNKKELEIVIQKIDTINNTDVSYEETATDKMKSRIIIDSIWEVYEGAKNEK